MREEFATYFQNEYLDQRSNWYEGYAPAFPSTNNGLESINNTVKKETTLRNKLIMTEFFQVMKQIVHGWSIDRDPNSPDYKQFHLTPIVNWKVMTDAYTWANDKTGAPVRSKRIDEQTVTHFIPAAGTKPLHKDDIDKYLNTCAKRSWKKFDTLRKGKQ